MVSGFSNGICASDRKIYMIWERELSLHERQKPREENNNMNESERMDIVIDLDDCVKDMREVIGKLRGVTGEDIPEYEHEPGDAFYNACEAKLAQVRDMAKLGHEILRVAWKYRDQMERGYTFEERVRDGAVVNTRYSKYGDEMTYDTEAILAARMNRILSQ